MKKIVLTFGLIAGAIMAGMMFATIPFIKFSDTSSHSGELLGYTTMVVSFLMVFFGIRSYRENIGNGAVSFGRAFKVGALIAVIGSCCYVAAWEVIYYTVAPDFIDKYSEHIVNQKKASGASPSEVAVMQAKMDKFAAAYKNPLVNIAMTFLEVLPVGLLVSLISALILRRRDAGGVLQPA